MPIKTQFDLSEQARVDALASINLTDPLAIDKDIQTKFTATGLNDADYPAYKAFYGGWRNSRNNILALQKRPTLTATATNVPPAATTQVAS
jgi:hypothetical protein